MMELLKSKAKVVLQTRNAELVCHVSQEVTKEAFLYDGFHLHYA